MKQVLVLVAVGAVAACGQAFPPSDPSPAPSVVPHVVAARTALPSCGTENATTQVGPWNGAGRACLWAAYQQGAPAEFISTRPTVEGDPITTIYRVLGTGRVELFVDSTQDRFGARIWTRLDCATLSGSAAEFGPDQSCSETPIS